MHRRDSNAAWIVVAVLLALPSIYMGSYIVLTNDIFNSLECDEEELGIDLEWPYRIEGEWVATFFTPARAVHKKARGIARDLSCQATANVR